MAIPSTPIPPVNTTMNSNHHAVKIQHLKYQNEQLQEKLKSIESSMVQFSQIGRNVESLICLIITQQNSVPTNPNDTGRLDPIQSQDDPAFAVPPPLKPSKSYAEAAITNAYPPPSTDGDNNSELSYGTEYPDIPGNSKLPAKVPTKSTPATSPDSTDTETDPTLSPEMEILADLISPKD